MNYEFDLDDLKRFAMSTGSRTKRVGKEIAFLSCPYCHGGMHRDKWTFSVSTVDGRFSCKRSSCQIRGNMITLARDFAFQLSEDVSRYYNIGGYNGKFKKWKDAHKSIDSTEPAIAYLKKRGISEETARAYEITTKAGTDNILVFPFKDSEGNLRFIKYRNLDFKKGITDGSKEWCESNCMPILFGMNKCSSEESKRLVITEGQIDSLSLAEASVKNAVSVPTGCNGFTWVPHCWDFMQQFDEIVVFGDFENGKITLLEEISKRFKKSIRHIREADYRDCKDANEILQKYGAEYLAETIDRAESVKLDKVIKLKDVKDVDLYAMEKMPTGIRSLDQRLMGGLPYGGFTIISGKPGEGKSTLASQILLSGVEHGDTCFVYSGELPNFMFKNWIMCQAAGPHHLAFEKHAGFGKELLFDPKAAERINDWFGDRMLIYDNQIIDDDQEEEAGLIALIEKVAVQYGARVFLIDNLMTCLDMEPDIKSLDKYEKQSAFCKKLAKLALKHEILILLVCHRRKNSISGDGNDEISGSGDISNLATVTLSFKKDKDNPNWRNLAIAKSRLFGFNAGDKDIKIAYDEKSRRLAEEGTPFDYVYAWEKDADGFSPATDQLVIPF